MRVVCCNPWWWGTGSWWLKHTCLSLTSPRREVEWNLLEMTFRYVFSKWIYFKIWLVLMLHFVCGSVYMLLTVGKDNDFFFFKYWTSAHQLLHYVAQKSISTGNNTQRNCQNIFQINWKETTREKRAISL